MVKNTESKYKWYILALAALTLVFGMVAQGACMPVLFHEISEDLNLSLIQIGTVWGMVGMGAIFVVMLGGLLGDRFGVKNTLSTICFLSGLAGAARGLSGSFTSLAITMFLLGLTSAMVPIIAFKPPNIWFSRQQLGVANTILTLSVALGGTLSSMFSATVMSPLLGGWRNVVFLYGALAFILGIPWLLTRSGPTPVEPSASLASKVPMRQAFSHIIRNKNVWLIALIYMGHSACSIGTKGFLALYLQGLGWTTATASGTLAVWTAASFIGAMPFTLLSNKLGSRKVIIITTVLMTTTGVGLLSVVTGPMVWVAVIIAGLAWEGYMASNFTMIMETEGVGVKYTGTALGLMWTLGRLGSIISPPIGNSLATINPSLAFIFWSALAVVPLLCSIHFLKETGWRAIKVS